MLRKYKIFTAAIMGIVLIVCNIISTGLLDSGNRSSAIFFLGIEGIAFIGGILSAGFTLIFIIIWLTKKNWTKLFAGVVSLSVFVILLVTYAYRGSGFLYAT